MAIKAIIFDVFGTLIRVEKGNSARVTMNRITAACGAEINEAEFLAEWRSYYADHTAEGCGFMTECRLFTSRIRMFYERYGVERNAAEDAAALLSAAYERKAYEDVQPAFSALRGKYRLILGSNTDNDILNYVAAANALCADSIYTSEDLRCYKPSRRFFERILEAEALRHDEVIFVGDNPRDDIAGPKQLGIRTVLIDREKSEKQYGQDYTITEMTELINIVDSLR